MSSWKEQLTDSERTELDKWNQDRSERKYATPESQLAEFGIYYGWAGIEAALSNRMTARLFLSLLEEGRRQYRYRTAQSLTDIRNAVVTALNGKEGNSQLQRIVRERIKD